MMIPPRHVKTSDSYAQVCYQELVAVYYRTKILLRNIWSPFNNYFASAASILLRMVITVKAGMTSYNNRCPYLLTAAQ